MTNSNTVSLSMNDYELCNKLKNMKLSGMAEELENILKDPNSDLIPFKEKLEKIIDNEWNLRYSKKLNRFIKKATLKYPSADIDKSIYEKERGLNTRVIEELAKCEWISQGKNLIITGKSGSGKSYLANALCICALKRFMTVKYTRASQLVNEMAKREKLDNLQEFIYEMSSYELLVIDDFGLMNLDVNKCRNLFEVLDSRDPHKSTMIISQFPVSSWYEIFQDHTYAEACLGRILDNSYRLEMNGRSMRNLVAINK